MKVFIIFGLFILFALNICAQDPSVAATKRSEMSKLSSLVGQWKGTGWIKSGPKREFFNGTETVQSKIDGLALLIEGKFANPEGIVTHETLAVLSPGEKGGDYRFKTYLANGISGDQYFKIIPNAFEWGFQFPGGNIRYTIKIENDTWTETGEFSRDAKLWIQTFEMTLKKVK